MQKLTDELKLIYPGVTIYGIGDDAHKTRISDHNEDDTAGVRAEQSDADTIPEHRAIDVMLGPHFNRGDAMDLVSDLTLPANRPRLQYVIFDGYKYTRANNYVKEKYDGEDRHEGHVHVSGRAANDDDTTPWLPASAGGITPAPPAPGASKHLVVDGELGPKTISRWQEVMGTPVDGVISTPKSKLIEAVQTRLKVVDHRLVIDGEFGPKTIGVLQRYLGTPVDQFISKENSQVVKALQRRLNEGRF
jgi:hypothetical protein